MPDHGDLSDSPEITSIAQLEETFDAGSKPRERWKIGVEYETPMVDTSSGDALPYSGRASVASVLEALRERTGWEGVYEADNLIALAGDGASITLEPGGQLEMSGRQCDSLFCAKDELDAHVSALDDVGSDLGVRFLGLGATPKTPLASMPWMPKERYRVMRGIMAGTGRLGHRMMQQTATVQANFDYESEHDAGRKFRLGMALPPVIVAVSANSPVIDGELTGYKSYRAHVWHDTDAARCGILPFAFDTENLFGAYTRYALDVPMYFLVRGGRLVPGEGRTFRDHLDGRFPGECATLADWSTHLTTLFPEVRLKTYIELRSADCQPIENMLAPPAFMKGLLYDTDCLEAALDVVRPWTAQMVVELWESAARYGLEARAPRHPLQDYARELVEIAREGLRRQACGAGDDADETAFLEPISAVVEAGATPADSIIELLDSVWDGSVQRLIDHCSRPPQ